MRVTRLPLGPRRDPGGGFIVLQRRRRFAHLTHRRRLDQQHRRLHRARRQRRHRLRRQHRVRAVRSRLRERHRLRADAAAPPPVRRPHRQLPESLGARRGAVAHDRGSGDSTRALGSGQLRRTLSAVRAARHHARHHLRGRQRRQYHRLRRDGGRRRQRHPRLRGCTGPSVGYRSRRAHLAGPRPRPQRADRRLQPAQPGGRAVPRRRGRRRRRASCSASRPG